MNLWSWIREFAKLNSWNSFREVEFVNSWSWIREAEIVNSWSWNREFVKLKPWIIDVEMSLPVFRNKLYPSFWQSVSYENAHLSITSKVHLPTKEKTSKGFLLSAYLSIFSYKYKSLFKTQHYLRIGDTLWNSKVSFRETREAESRFFFRSSANPAKEVRFGLVS